MYESVSNQYPCRQRFHGRDGGLPGQFCEDAAKVASEYEGYVPKLTAEEFDARTEKCNVGTDAEWQ